MVARLRHPWIKAAGTPADGLFEADTDLSDPALLAALHNEHGPQADRLFLDELRDKRRRRREEQAAHDRQERQERIAQQAQDEASIAGDLMLVWLGSEEYRRLTQEVLGEISDARQAARRAYERAVEEERIAREALEEAQANAITLADGRRVYFTKDGKRLFAEDDVEITDAQTLQEAARLRAGRPDATTHESYVERWQRHRAATDRVERLSDALQRLDELDERVRNGKLSREELQQIRAETQAIVGSLPPEAPEEYEHLQAVRNGERKLAHRSADPSFESAPAASKEFRRAQTAAGPRPEPTEPTPEQQPLHPPLYKAAPDL